MEAGFMLLVFLAVSTAFALGYLLGRAGGQSEAKGTIHIIADDHDAKMYPYLESNIPMDELATMSKVVFDVKTAHQNSHE